MGLEIFIAAARPVAEALTALAAAGAPAQILMVDGQLVPPGFAVPSAFTELRLRGDAGMVTLRRRPGGISVVVFGNATDALLAFRDRVVTAFAP
jgi:hypothetical protein